jgi:hypothetical protein
MICMWCEEPIAAHEPIQWVPHIAATATEAKPWHVECLYRSIAGGLNHQNGTCSCCGGSDPPDPPGLSRREAAMAVWKRGAQP